MEIFYNTSTFWT